MTTDFRSRSYNPALLRPVQHRVARGADPTDAINATMESRKWRSHAEMGAVAPLGEDVGAD